MHVISLIRLKRNRNRTKFSRNTLLSYIVFSQKFKLKLISAKFLLPMIFRNELSITLSTLWIFEAVNKVYICYICTTAQAGNHSSDHACIQPHTTFQHRVHWQFTTLAQWYTEIQYTVYNNYKVQQAIHSILLHTSRL